MSKNTVLAGFLLLLPSESLAEENGFFPRLPAAQQAYASYAVAANCEGPDLQAALDIVQVRLTFAKSEMVVDDMQGTTDGVEDAIDVGRAIIALGDAALEKKCFNTSKDLFLSVIETFTGTAYEALRDRAQIGLDGVRAAQG